MDVVITTTKRCQSEHKSDKNNSRTGKKVLSVLSAWWLSVHSLLFPPLAQIPNPAMILSMLRSAGHRLDGRIHCAPQSQLRLDGLGVQGGPGLVLGECWGASWCQAAHMRAPRTLIRGQFEHAQANKQGQSVLTLTDGTETELRAWRS